MAKPSYSELLRDPKWQKRRLEILQRDEWHCQSCFASENTLHVHHRYYESNVMPWEYDDHCLVTLCEDCHKQETVDLKMTQKQLLKGLASWGFLSEQIHRIAYAFGMNPPLHASEPAADIVAFAISDPECREFITDRFFKDCRRRHQEAIKATDEAL